MNESHRKLRAFARQFVEKELVPYVQQWTEANDCKWERPFMIKLAQAGFLPGMLGISPWPTEYTDIKVGSWDLIYFQAE